MKKFFLFFIFFSCAQLHSLHRVPKGSYLRADQCGDSCTMIQGRIECTACAISPQERVTKRLFNAHACPVQNGRFDIVSDSERDMLKCLPKGTYLSSCGNCKMENDN